MASELPPTPAPTATFISTVGEFGGGGWVGGTVLVAAAVSCEMFTGQK